GVEGVVELLDRWGVGEAEAEVIWGNDPVFVGQVRDEIAEHERAGREAVQEHDHRSVSRTGLPVEQLMSFDGCVPVVNVRHVFTPWIRRPAYGPVSESPWRAWHRLGLLHTRGRPRCA